MRLSRVGFLIVTALLAAFLGTPPSIAISITAATAPPGAVASALATAARTVAREGCH